MGKVNDNKNQQINQKLLYTMFSKKQKRWQNQHKKCKINNELKVLEETSRTIY